MMFKRQLDSREAIGFLVRTFYARVREDETLGPIFNGVITDWETHLEKLTDFWEGNLLFFVKKKFEGDPKTAHQKVDEWMGNRMTMEHFGRWINLWIATLDEHFEGETAQIAKNQARKMATFFYLKVFENRLAKTN
ncbi:MAG: group III truncated hemoglobin [Saprospiraceae bacterium]|nr:group III truncated hemoglobin [Saprospiraceae bacterium]